MKNKKNFRIKRTVKMDELANKNQLIQQTLQKIVGGRTASEPKGPLYGRLIGYMEPNQPTDI